MISKYANRQVVVTRLPYHNAGTLNIAVATWENITSECAVLCFVRFVRRHFSGTGELLKRDVDIRCVYSVHVVEVAPRVHNEGHDRDTLWVSIEKAILSCPVLSSPVPSYPILFRLILSYPVVSYLMVSCPIISCCDKCKCLITRSTAFCSIILNGRYRFVDPGIGNIKIDVTEYKSNPRPDRRRQTGMEWRTALKGDAERVLSATIAQKASRTCLLRIEGWAGYPLM
jgi:hypothetical protein